MAIPSGFRQINGIATACSLAMTVVVVRWSLCAGGTVVIDGVYCGTVITVPYGVKLPRFRRNGGVRI